MEGLRERPVSGAPKPVICEEMVPAEVVMVREPVRWPVAVGLKAIWTKQEAETLRVPVQGEPPLAAELRAKSPLRAGAVRVMGVALEVRLVRAKRAGALVLLMGTMPKSCVAGVRTRPSRGRPIPERVTG